MQKKHQITITGEKFDDLCELKIEQFRIFHSTLLLIQYKLLLNEEILSEQYLC